MPRCAQVRGFTEALLGIETTLVLSCHGNFRLVSIAIQTSFVLGCGRRAKCPLGSSALPRANQHWLRIGVNGKGGQESVTSGL